METEFKFCIDDTSLVDKILNDSMLDDYVDRNALEIIDMKAVYFDTDDLDLRKAGIAYRVRYENDRITATVKWDNKVEDGLHSREEFNLVINDERFAMEPDIEAFESSEAYDVLIKAAGNKKLKEVMKMDFTRELLKIDTGDSISALSFDIGTVHGESGDVPISEMELEWYHGSEENFKYIASKLAEKYNLKSENISKLQKGFAE